MPVTPENLRDQVIVNAAQVSFPGPMPPVDRELIARVVISKAYYAVYHKALNIARFHGYRFKQLNAKAKRAGQKTRSSHEALWNWYFEIGRDDIKQSAESLKKLRTLADYQVQLPLPEGTMDDAVGEMEELFAVLEDFHLDMLANAPVA